MCDLTTQEKALTDLDTEFACSTLVDKELSVSISGTVKPYRRVGPIEVYCCNEPRVIPAWKPSGQKCGACAFTVQQDLIVHIPLGIGAHVFVDDIYTDCNGACPVNEVPTK